jgi:hypothetical protein
VLLNASFYSTNHLWSHHEAEAKHGLISCIRWDQICKVICCAASGLWVKDKRFIYTSDFALASAFLKKGKITVLKTHKPNAKSPSEIRHVNNPLRSIDTFV